jgi:hypothetical protein
MVLRGQARRLPRSGHPWRSTAPTLAARQRLRQAVRRDPSSARITISAESIVNGELVALDAQGRPDFQSIQNSKTSGSPVVFFAFDLLVLAGRDVRMLPLAQRQRLLRDALRTSDLAGERKLQHPRHEDDRHRQRTRAGRCRSVAAQQSVRIGSPVRSLAEAVPHPCAGVCRWRLHTGRPRYRFPADRLLPGSRTPVLRQR